MNKNTIVLGTLPLGNGKDLDPYKIAGSGSK
jgi:hypothetical protein